MVEYDNSLCWELWLLVKIVLYSSSYDYFFLIKVEIVENWLKKKGGFKFGGLTTKFVDQNLLPKFDG